MKKITVILFAMMALAACKKDQDTTKPEVKTITVNGVEAAEHELQTGATISINISVSDDKALNQMKVNVHAADDEHTHSGAGEGGSSSSEPNVGTWVYSQIINLDGTSASRTLSLAVPDSIQGHWHLEVQLIDESGNEAQEAVTILHVTNPGAPQFSISPTPPLASGIIDLTTTGGVLILSGEAMDSDGIASMSIQVENHNTSTIIDEVTYDPAGVTGFMFPTYSLDSIPAGTYHVIITARDTQGNGAIWFAEAENQ